ncbi:histidine kinase, partial [Conexibacter sp. CPCC 205706]|uniref:sensor histidine kinase n=1 Tax=Conexibacter sp. CPCC 205706 TaxID=3064572 RepID=UPI0027207684
LRDRGEAPASARRRAEAAARDGGAVELALGDERRRIARELHAVATGCVRAVLDEVATARSSLARASGAAEAALLRARTASQQAMAEMRRMLVLLRGSEPARRPDAADVPASLRELGARGGTVLVDGRAAGGRAAPEAADLPLPAVAMRVLVALAELPGCERLAVARDGGLVRASARLARVPDPVVVGALGERARLAGGRLRHGRLLWRRRLTVVLPARAGGPLPRSSPQQLLGRVPWLRAQGIPLLIFALEATEALLTAGRPAAFYGAAPLPVRLAGATALALAFVPRRRWPLLSVLAVVAICMLRTVVFDDAFGLNPPLYLAAFVAGAYVRPLWLAALGAAACVAGGFLTVVLAFDWNWELYPPNMLLFFATMVTAAWATGVGGRRRLAQADELRALSSVEERRQGRAIERAVEAERLRVARELHDLVGHGLTSITLQCAVAAQQLESAPRQAAAAIAAVEEVGAEVLRELHQLLAALDGSAAPAAPELARLRELARRAGAHGLDVRLELAGDLASVPAGHAGAAYRIVQEALTNARKHGGAGPVGARVARERGRLAIEVRNSLASPVALADAAPAAALPLTASPATAAGSGLGLAGMRERVRVYDGWLTAGPDDAGDWLVRAELPLPA